MNSYVLIYRVCYVVFVANPVANPVANIYAYAIQRVRMHVYYQMFPQVHILRSADT